MGASAGANGPGRPYVRGKNLFVDGERFFLRGVTYGPFRPEPDGSEYHTPELASEDFARMAEAGINTVRLYTVPPRWLLDVAQRHGLKVMVGLPWEQHVAFLESRKQRLDIERRVREAARQCAGHPALLCLAIGNEIPPSIVRWHGRRRIEAFLRRLTRIVRRQDPGALVTYVNFPTTEYLSTPFTDFDCFNVYLETPEELEAYLARLQTLAGSRPLVIAEAGLDSIRNGQDQQAETLAWQLRSIFTAGGAGAFVFAWTDEWFRGGFEIDDWAFGLTDRQRRSKPALAAVRRAYASIPFADGTPWPKVSVVVCTHNGHGTIEQTCEGLLHLDYPDYEVLVVDDGSSAPMPALLERYKRQGVRVIPVNNGGLSRARNIGMRAARGDIVAYIDDDAWPDPLWLKHLAWVFLTRPVGAVGGPNLPPPGDGMAADCIANSPGGPNHVLLTDETAEHIPGCNMAFWRECLEALGGFDPQFRIAGDDVDVCWRFQCAGWQIGFSHAAVVWHHRRNSVGAYLRQQTNYGRAEAMLERKCPGRYNAAGHIPWNGRVYGPGGRPVFSMMRQRIYHGVWGSAPFQPLYEPTPGIWSGLLMMPEWYLATALLAALAMLGISWPPLLLSAPLAAIGVAFPLVQATMEARRARFADRDDSPGRRVVKRLLTGTLHLIQPLVRLRGRLGDGLTPWRRRHNGFAWPVRRHQIVWSEFWRANEDWLAELMQRISDGGVAVTHGGEYDGWDLCVRGGLCGAARINMAIEEHGEGRQMLRFRVTPSGAGLQRAAVVALCAMAVAAGLAQAWGAAAGLGALALGLVGWCTRDAGGAVGSALAGIRRLKEEADEQLAAAQQRQRTDEPDETEVPGAAAPLALTPATPNGSLGERPHVH